LKLSGKKSNSIGSIFPHVLVLQMRTHSPIMFFAESKSVVIFIEEEYHIIYFKNIKKSIDMFFLLVD
jgi:hypothetical protein